jgi:hypothetical protein
VLLTLPLIVWRMFGGKRESLSVYCPDCPLSVCRLWSYEQCFLCLCWNMCSQYKSALCTLWSLWWQQCFFTIWQQMSLVFLIDSLECSLSSLQLPSDHYKRWRIPPQASFNCVSRTQHGFRQKFSSWSVTELPCVAFFKPGSNWIFLLYIQLASFGFGTPFGHL